MKLNDKKKWIAITGGIGAGKTVVSDYLRANGCRVFSCDEIVKKLYKDRNFRLKLLYIFPEIYDKQNIISKEKLTEIVFSDADKLKALNDAVHPAVFQKINQLAEELDDTTIFVEAPVLFEGKWERLFDKVVVVTRPIGDRIASVIKRSDMTEEQVRDRIKSQVDYDTMDLSDYIVIANDSTEEVLAVKLDIFYSEHQADFQFEKGKK